ncbi:MAG: amidohydrolase [Promethearchaeota archaeon]
MFDQLIYNGRIYSMEREHERFSAMGIEKGKIVKLFESDPGNPDSVSKKTIDLEGKAVLPGLIDSHTHFMASALSEINSLTISELIDGKLQPDTLEGVKDKVQEFAKIFDQSIPIICRNYITASIKEDRLPYWREIEEWLPNRDVIFLTIDGHASSFSKSALKKMGFNPNNHDGILSGEEHENNGDKLGKIIMQSIDLRAIIGGIQKTINTAIENGIVGIDCMESIGNGKKNSSLWFFKKYAGLMPLYLRLYPQVRDVNKIKDLEKLFLHKRFGGCGACQMDGAVGAKTAAFFKPYLGKGQSKNFGKILYPKEDLLKDLRAAHNLGYQFTSHAIGTRAIEHLLNAYKTVLTEKRDTKNRLRNRIDHFEFPTREHVDLAIDDLNLIVVPQPGWAWMDKNFPGMSTYKKYLRPEIVNLQIPLKMIVEKGGIICGSSDSPVQQLDPFIQIHGMVNFPIKNERLSVYEAFRTFTYNGAYATFEEDSRGTLSKGKWADFIIMEEKNDPFNVSKNSLIKLKIDSTYIHGGKVSKLNINNFEAFTNENSTQKTKI